MVLISIFLIIIIYLHPISAVKCPSCIDICINTTSTSLSINESYCDLIIESAAVCKSELYVELIDTYPAVINYITAPSNALITGNADSVLVTTINIPLDIGNPYGSFIYDCYDEDLCNNKIVQKQYEELHVVNYTELTIKLTELLYNNQSISKRQPIECYNRNNQIEQCSINRNCQATLIIEQERSDLLITTSISDRRPGSLVGLRLRSKSVGNDYKKITISYTCNKNRCNDPVIVRQIRQIFFDIGFINSKANSLKFLSIILFITCLIINICTRFMSY
ncbi:unnamed protein product [Rotaria sordida]|uniref:Uncharacterized protein n=1 Tax=Rotaria sordida TaxID=392033 RepID=A0A814BLM2_9BILA|nr:unnamed protein product [Rotaria sordida]